MWLTRGLTIATMAVFLLALVPAAAAARNQALVETPSEQIAPLVRQLYSASASDRHRSLTLLAERGNCLPERDDDVGAPRMHTLLGSGGSLFSVVANIPVISMPLMSAHS